MRKSEKLAPCVLLVGTLLVLGAATTPTPAATRPDVVAIPAAATLDACVMCAEHCENGYHDAWDDDPSLEDFDRAGGAHPLEDNCWSGSCDTKHGPCNQTVPDAVTDADIETLRRHVAMGDEGGMAATIEAHRRQIIVNAERSAIQVTNCAGMVVVHMPISRPVALSLTAANED